jgi:hypothetical protein
VAEGTLGLSSLLTGVWAMSLPVELFEVLLTFGCKACGLQVRRKGSWFKSLARFKCAGCHHEERMSYDDKINLFRKHVRLVEGSGQALFNRSAGPRLQPR